MTELPDDESVLDDDDVVGGGGFSQPFSAQTCVSAHFTNKQQRRGGEYAKRGERPDDKLPASTFNFTLTSSRNFH